MLENTLIIFVAVLGVCCAFLGVLCIITEQDGKEK